MDAAKVITGRMPASLTQTTVVVNGLFGAVSGAAVAAAAAVGNVMHGRMVKDGYDKRFAAAVNVASAPAGMLIPPSNTFIVYSLVSTTSIAALFMAGVIPGILWIVACMIVVHLYARKQPCKLKSQERVAFKDGLKIIWRAVPSLLMIVIVVGGILGGYFTATESASIAVVYCLILSMLYRTIKVKHLPGILVDASRTTVIVMLLVAVSTALSFVMSFARIPDLIASSVLGLTESPAVVMLIIVLILLAIGTFMDPTPAILIFVPIFLPIATELGIDPIHLGTATVMALSIGVITPPVGNVVFVGARVARLRIEPVISRLWPFLIAIVIALFIVAYVLALSTWLPGVMGL